MNFKRKIQFANKEVQHYSIRKLGIGVASVLIGVGLYFCGANCTVYAATKSQGGTSTNEQVEKKVDKEASPDLPYQETNPISISSTNSNPDFQENNSDIPNPKAKKLYLETYTGQLDLVPKFPSSIDYPKDNSEINLTNWATKIEDETSKANQNQKFKAVFRDVNNNVITTFDPKTAKNNMIFVGIYPIKEADNFEKIIDSTQKDQLDNNPIYVDGSRSTKFHVKELSETGQVGLISSYNPEEKVISVIKNDITYRNIPTKWPESYWEQGRYTVTYTDSKTHKKVTKYTALDPAKCYQGWVNGDASNIEKLKNPEIEFKNEKDFEKFGEKFPFLLKPQDSQKDLDDFIENNLNAPIQQQLNQLDEQLKEALKLPQFQSPEAKKELEDRREQTKSAIEKEPRISYQNVSAGNDNFINGMAVLVPECNDDGSFITDDKGNTKWAGINYIVGTPSDSDPAMYNFSVAFCPIDQPYLDSKRPLGKSYLYLGGGDSSDQGSFLVLSNTYKPVTPPPYIPPHTIPDNPKEDNQYAQLNIVDESTGKIITLDTLHAVGVSDTPIIFSKGEQAVAKYLAQGYKFVSAYNDTLDKVMTGNSYNALNFGNYDDNDAVTQCFTIYLIKGETNSHSDKPETPKDNPKMPQTSTESSVQVKQPSKIKVHNSVLTGATMLHNTQINNNVDKFDNIKGKINNGKNSSNRKATLPQTGENKASAALASLIGLNELTILGLGINLLRRKKNK